VCDSTYVNGRRRKFFENIFSALSRLDDAKEKFRITAPPCVEFPIVSPELADANHTTIEEKGTRPRLTIPRLDPYGKFEDNYLSTRGKYVIILSF
jgi:hypothetical protein